MKLHLPLPLRRALYRTFALSLAGAACSIGNATEYTMDEKNNFLPTSPVTLGNGDKIIWNSANNDYNIGAWSNKEYTLTLAAGGDWGMDGNFKGTLHLGNASGTATLQNNVILNVTGGTYITNNVITCQYGHNYPNGATINVSGGTLQINDLIAENGGWTTLNISGGTFTAKSIKSEGVNEAPASKGIAIRVSGGTANLGHLWTDTNPPPRHATLLWTGGKLSVNAQYNVDATFGVNNQNTTLTTTGDLSLPQMVNVLGNVTLDITNGGSASLAGGVSKAITVKNGTASNNLNQNKKISWNGVSASWTGSYTVSNGNLVDGDANQAQKLAVHSGTLTLSDSLLDSLTIGGGATINATSLKVNNTLTMGGGTLNVSSPSFQTGTLRIADNQSFTLDRTIDIATKTEIGTNASLTVNANGQNLKQVSGRYGTLIVSGHATASSVDVETLTMNGGTLNVPIDRTYRTGTLQIADGQSFTLNQTIDITQKTKIGTNARLEVAATGQKLQQVSGQNGTLIVSKNATASTVDVGTLTMNGGTLTVSGDTFTTGTLRIADNRSFVLGQRIDINTKTEIGNNASLTVTTTGQNLQQVSGRNGTLIVSGSATASSVDVGTLTMNGGTLNVSGNTFQTGTLRIADNQSFTLDRTIDIATRTEIGQNASLTVEATGQNLQQVSGQNGTLIVSKNATASTVDVGTLTMNGGTLTVSGDTFQTGTLRIADNQSFVLGQRIDIATRTEIGQNASLEVTATGQHLNQVSGKNGSLIVSGNATANSVDVGTLTMNGGTLNVSGDTFQTGTLRIADNQSFMLDRTIDIATRTEIGQNASLEVTATGQDLKQISGQNGALIVSGNATASTVDVGTLTMNGGTLTVSGDTFQTGTLRIADNQSFMLDRTIDIATRTEIGQNASLTVTATGQDLKQVFGQNGALIVSGNATASTVDVGTLTINSGGQLTSSGNVTATGGSILGILNVTGNADIATVSSGTVHASGNISALSVINGSLTSDTGSITVENSVNGSTRLTALKGSVTLTGGGSISEQGSIQTDDIFVRGSNAAYSFAGAISADTLAVQGASLALSHDGNRIETTITIDDQGQLSLNHTVGSANQYGHIVNNGSLAAINANIASLQNNSDITSTVTGGALGTATNGVIANQKGELIITDASIGMGADISNAGTLTLDGVKNEEGTTAGTLANNDGAVLVVTGQSELTVSSAALGGDRVDVLEGSILVSTDEVSLSTEEVNVSGTISSAGTMTVSSQQATVSGGTLASDGKMAIEGHVALEADADRTATLQAGEEGLTIAEEAEVTGVGAIISAGDIAVDGSLGTADEALVGDVSGKGLDIAGTANVQGNVTATETVDVSGSLKITGSLTADTLAVTGDGTVNGTVDLEYTQVTNGGEVSITSTEEQKNVLGDISVSGSDSLLTLNGGSYEGTAEVSQGGNLTLDDSIFTGNVSVTDAYLTMNNAIVNGAVSFEGDNLFTITGENTINGSLTLSSGTTTVQTGTLTVNPMDGTLPETPTHPGAGTQAILVHGDSTFMVRGHLQSDVTICNGTLSIGGENARFEGGLTFQAFSAAETEANRIVAINTPGDRVNLETLNVLADGIIRINGQEGSDASLTLNVLTGEADATLTITGADSTLILTQENADFASDVDSSVGTISLRADNALGSEGVLTLLEGSGEINTDGAGEAVTLGKDIVSEVDLTLNASDRDLTLEGAVDAAGKTLTANGGNTLTFSGDSLTAEALVVNSGGTVLLDSQEANVTNITNNGTLTAINANIGSLLNNSGSGATVTGGFIGNGTDGGIDNSGTLTVTDSSMKNEAVISNSGTLTLTGVKNEDGTAAGVLSNTAAGTLTVNGGSNLTVSSAALGGDRVEVLEGSILASTGEVSLSAEEVNVNGTISSAGKMTVDSSKVTLTDGSLVSTADGADDAMDITGTVILASDGGQGSSISAGEAGLNISDTGAVTGTGDIASAGSITVNGSIGTAVEALVGDVSGKGLDIAGTANIRGNVTATETVDVSGSLKITGSLTADTLTVAGDGTGTVNGTVALKHTQVTNGGEVSITGTEEQTNALGDISVSGSDSLLTLGKGTYTGTATVKDSGVLALDNATFTGNVSVTDASLAMNDSTVNGAVSFEGDNLFTIAGDNTINGSLTLSAGTTTMQTGTLTVNKDSGSASGDLLHPDAPLQAILVHGGSEYKVLGDLQSDVTICNGTLSIGDVIDGRHMDGSLTGADGNGAVLTFQAFDQETETGMNRVVNVNTDGGNVNLATVVVHDNGTININGAYDADAGTYTGTGLELAGLEGEADATLTITGADSTLILTQENADFASDVDSSVGTISLRADNALGSEGVLTLLEGSGEINTDGAGEAVTLGKDIVSEVDLTLNASDRDLTLEGAVDAAGKTLTANGGNTLTFSGDSLTAEALVVNSGGTVALDGETVNVADIKLTHDGAQAGTLIIRNGTTIADSNTVTLDGTETYDALVQVTDTVFATGASVQVASHGTIETQMDTTLTGAVSGEGTLVKTGDAALVLSNSNNGFTGTLEHTQGALKATADHAFGTKDATVKLGGGETVELVGVNAGNAWDIQEGSNLVVTQNSAISGTITGNGSTLRKTGQMLTVTGADADTATKDSYTIELADGSLTLDRTERRGTLAAAANTEINVVNGRSTVGGLALAGDYQSALHTLNENATHVVIGSAAAADGDHIASATGDLIDAGGAQLVIKEFAEGAGNLSDGDRLLVAENIQGFDTEIVHGLVEKNVTLVHEGGNSYAEVSINHKGANKNRFEQGVSDALTASEGTAGRLGELVAAMAHTVSEADAVAALNSIGGAGIATTMAAQMSANRDHMRTLRGAIGQPRLRLVPGDGKGIPQWEQDKNLWMMATGASTNLGNDSMGGAGYTRHDAGILAGCDVTPNRQTLAGLAAGYSRSHVNSAGHTISGDQYFVDAYGRVNTGSLSQSATFGVGIYDWNLDRTVYVKTGDLYADFFGKGKGQAKGVALNFSYEAAYNIRLTERQTLAPVFQVESSWNHIGGYRENSGTLGNAGLDVGFDDAWATTLGIGVRYGYEFGGFGTATQKGVLSAHVMFIGDVGDVNGKMTGRFIGSGTAFDAESTKNSRTGILMGVDVLVPVSERWSLFGNANFEIREGYRDVSAGAGARYSF